MITNILPLFIVVIRVVGVVADWVVVDKIVVDIVVVVGSTVNHGSKHLLKEYIAKQ